MMKLDKIEDHIVRFPSDKWNKLFALIPIIESTKEFIIRGGIEEDEDDSDIFNITPVIEAKVVLDFERIMYELNLVIDYDWPDWREGHEFAGKRAYKNLDAITLLKLLTAFIRNNRFCDGALADRFQDGSILSILKVLKNNIVNKYHLSWKQ